MRVPGVFLRVSMTRWHVDKDFHIFKAGWEERESAKATENRAKWLCFFGWCCFWCGSGCWRLPCVCAGICACSRSWPCSKRRGRGRYGDSSWHNSVNSSRSRPVSADCRRLRPECEPARADRGGRRTECKPASADRRSLRTGCDPARADRGRRRTEREPARADRVAWRTEREPARADRVARRTECDPARADRVARRPEIKPASADCRCRGLGPECEPTNADRRALRPRSEPARAVRRGPRPK